jgi:hypothetical protein
MVDRFGRTRVSKILAAFDAHRAAVASGDMVAAQDTWDRLEPWIDFVFGRAGCPVCKERGD